MTTNTTAAAVTRPFQGGVAKPGITLKHRALIWECMFGAVYAKNAKGEVKYFDYDYAGAHAFAGVADCSDLRIAKTKVTYADSPRKGQYALYGVRVSTHA